MCSRACNIRRRSFNRILCKEMREKEREREISAEQSRRNIGRDVCACPIGESSVCVYVCMRACMYVRVRVKKGKRKKDRWRERPMKTGVAARVNQSGYDRS